MFTCTSHEPCLTALHRIAVTGTEAQASPLLMHWAQTVRNYHWPRICRQQEAGRHCSSRVTQIAFRSELRLKASEGNRPTDQSGTLTPGTSGCWRCCASRGQPKWPAAVQVDSASAGQGSNELLCSRAELMFSWRACQLADVQVLSGNPGRPFACAGRCGRHHVALLGAG